MINVDDVGDARLNVVSLKQLRVYYLGMLSKSLRMFHRIKELVLAIRVRHDTSMASYTWPQG